MNPTVMILLTLLTFLTPAARAGETGGARYDDELARLDARLEVATQRAESSVDSWMPWETVAALQASRARLTGSFAGWAQAQAALDLAYSIAPEGAGPHLTQASVAFGVHRLDAADEALVRADQRALKDDRWQSRRTLLAADIDLARGEYDRARVGFERALDLHPSFDGVVRLALFYAQTGHESTAEHLLQRADAMEPATPITAAWVDLQRGLLDLERDRVREALRHYRDAEVDLAGWWLVEEHIAEALGLLGDTAAAVALYEDLIARTGDPEFMTALAGLLTGDAAEAWIRRAAAGHEERMQQLPEAAIGHALDFHLEHGPDAAQTLRMARENARLRAGGASQLALARAHLAVGETEAAGRVLDALRATSYRPEEVRRVWEELAGM